MSAPHFFAGAPDPGASVVLDAEDARHAIRSLRLRTGDELTSSDGRGGMARCRVMRAERLLVEAEVLERTTVAPPSPRLAVLVAPPKGERLTWAVQKLTEVGADEIVLLDAPRSVRRWEGDRAAKAAVRIDAVAREAAKQSRRAFLPQISGPVPWVEAVTPGEGPMILLWERATAPLLGSLPEDHRGRVSLVVGPEGGIDEDDARAAEADGALLASLGPNVLRTETAAVVAAAVTLARYGRLGEASAVLV